MLFGPLNLALAIFFRVGYFFSLLYNACLGVTILICRLLIVKQVTRLLSLHNINFVSQLFVIVGTFLKQSWEKYCFAAQVEGAILYTEQGTFQNLYLSYRYICVELRRFPVEEEVLCEETNLELLGGEKRPATFLLGSIRPTLEAHPKSGHFLS
jgi:hypothetical protein